MDNELITAARNGDSNALKRLASRYMEFALEKAKGFVHSQLEYDDIVQEAMLGFISAYYTYDINGGASFKTYVSRCMDNSILSAIALLERKKRIPTGAIVGLDDVSAVDTRDDPEEVFFRHSKEEEIVRKIREELSEKERTVLSLFMSGMKYEEIADEMSITSKSVDNAIQRIRKKLREVE